MDPISQGVLGATAALTLSSKTTSRFAALAGACGGMIADLDVLIRSSSDPLLNLEYHRHFSHSLFFIPVGGLIAAILLLPFLKSRLSFVELVLYSTAGYATAGLLDACTSYGTQLLWPFADARVSWSIISIIDPLFTVPLMIFVGLAVKKRSPRLGRIAACFSLAYLSIGFVQNQRASNTQATLIASRGHQGATSQTVKPSIANLVLWRSVYLYQGNYYIDAIRVGWFAENEIYAGSNIPAFKLPEALENLSPDDPLALDLTRFDHFSEGYLAALPEEPTFLTDLRYAAIPNSISPLWGIDLSTRTESGHVLFETRREISKADRERFLSMLKGE